MGCERLFSSQTSSPGDAAKTACPPGLPVSHCQGNSSVILHEVLSVHASPLGRGPLAFVHTLGKFLDHFLIEGRDVVGLTAGH